MAGSPLGSARFTRDTARRNGTARHGPGLAAVLGDVTTGNNTVQFPPETITGYRAAPGWDPVTGWGSPDAGVLVPLLARHAAS